MTPGQRAEALVAELGITDAKDLDVEAIAFDSGVMVEYQKLTGCEATLAGFGDKAIATIKKSSIRGRDRYSIGHELGHWKMHRGRSFRCRVDDPDENFAPDRLLEKEADQFAAHLLMPGNIFDPAIKSLGQPGFREIEVLAEQFQTSLLATSIRLANINSLPVIVACYSSLGLHWHVTASDIPRRWFLRDKLDSDSFAYDLITNGIRPAATPRKQSGEVWFENDDAEEYDMMEHCTSYHNGKLLVVLYLTPNMLTAKFDPSVGNRRYTESGSYVPSRLSKKISSSI